MEPDARSLRLMLESKQRVVDPIAQAGDLLAAQREQQIKLPLGDTAPEEGDRRATQVACALDSLDHRKEGNPQNRRLPIAQRYLGRCPHGAKRT